VKRIFYAETFIIGFLSALIGLLLLYLLMPLINLGLYQITGIKGVGYLPIIYGLMILILNTLLTSIAGLIPANIASKKDPIVALRNE
jgi:putative ABC transport system permease protein